DVVEERIVDSSIRCRFLALSYVWGGCQKFQSTKQNQSFLGQRCSLRDVGLPLTIRDAIDLVREIGERYLWVDSLCITQDDDDYKMGQIRLMDQIYNNAVAVIICAT
ncbi:heterokaryon incompatibility, partial [Usnea florida]